MSHPLPLTLRHAGARALLSHPRPPAGASRTTPPPTSFTEDAYVLVVAAESTMDRRYLVGVSLMIILLAVAVVYCACAWDGQEQRARPRRYVVADACATPRRPAGRPVPPWFTTAPPGAAPGHGPYVEVEYGT